MRDPRRLRATRDNRADELTSGPEYQAHLDGCGRRRGVDAVLRTPVLAVLLGALGLTAFVAKLDYVLIPVFIASIAVVIFALVRRRRSCAAKTPEPT